MKIAIEMDGRSPLDEDWSAPLSGIRDAGENDLNPALIGAAIDVPIGLPEAGHRAVTYWPGGYSELLVPVPGNGTAPATGAVSGMVAGSVK